MRSSFATEPTRLEVAISLTRESSRLVWVPAWRKQWGRSQNGQSLFTYMYHLSPYRVPSPPLPRLPSLPLPSRLSPSPLFVSVMFSNSSGARHDTRGVPGLESIPESKLHHCCGFDYDSRKNLIIKGCYGSGAGIDSGIRFPSWLQF